MFSASLFAASGRAQSSRIKAGLRRALALGIEVGEVPPSAFSDSRNYLAGVDNVRLSSIEQALSDSTDLAWAVRGGYGMTRLAPFSSLPLTEKPALGFSDVTALLAAVHQAGGRAVHGPVLTSFAQADAATEEALITAINGGVRQWSLEGMCEPMSVPIVGGNLEVLTRLIGTSINPTYAGHMVVIEDIGEPWYRCDRSLTHLFAATDIGRAAAIVFGEFIDCEEGTVERLSKRIINLGIPCLTGAPVGHGPTNHAFVWGERTSFSQGILTLSGALS